MFKTGSDLPGRAGRERPKPIRRSGEGERSWFSRCRAAVAALCGLLSVFAAPAEPAANTFWQRQSIYQVITDRFYDGDPANNNADGNYDPSGHRGTSVHGGDFKGLEAKLDYIQALGATAIWISPIVVNARGEFHGYAGQDFYHVDPHWGTLADLQHFVAAAHARGMLVIDDVVVNHGGNLIDSADAGYGRFRSPPGGYELRFRDPGRRYAPPFDLKPANPSLTNLFHNHGLIHDYQNSTQAELGELAGLDDFRTESPYVRAHMQGIYEFWIEEGGFDGFRIDTVKHVEMGFWQEWCPDIHQFAARHHKPAFFLFGEVLDASEAKCGAYTGTKAGGAFALDSVLDYPLYFKVNDVFARATAGTCQLAERYRALAANYDPRACNQLVTFLDNHDQPRFLSAVRANNRIDRLKVALVFLYTAQGIPCLYYGTEQAFNGGTDPWDREDMFAGQFEQGPSCGDNFNYTHPLFQWVARLNNLRRLYPALQTGTQTNLYCTTGPGLFAYTRRLGGQEVLVVLNTAETNQTLAPCPIRYPAGTALVNLLDPNESLTVFAPCTTPALQLPPLSAKVLLPRAQVRPLAPLVTSVTPAHDETVGGDARLTPIVLEFSQPMRPATVESAFATAPPLTGTFSWSAAHERVTFTPNSPGWPAETAVTLQVARKAAAVGGHTLTAAFEARFKTPTRWTGTN